YTLAIGYLNNLLIENHNDYNALFYSGMSYFQLENYMKAREFFQKLNENNNHTFYEETKYYLALSHLNLDNKIQAKNLLEDVIKINSFYKDRAQEQLKNSID